MESAAQEIFVLFLSYKRRRLQPINACALRLAMDEPPDTPRSDLTHLAVGNVVGYL